MTQLVKRVKRTANRQGDGVSMSPRDGFLMAIGVLLSLLGSAAVHAADTADPPAKISPARAEANGVLVHEVRSDLQAGVTTLRVLPPEKLDKSKSATVVYLLPVEARDGSHYGDPILEAKKLDLADKHGVVIVEPTFWHLPWYADHPTDRRLQQEKYFLKVVIPFVEETYPVRQDAAGRLLVGFSKSGWGAFSLLLRHPDVFGKAAAWDAPLMMDQPGKYGSGDIFGTAENFKQYQISELLARRAKELQKGKRLLLVGSANFREEHVRAHALMDTLKIDHAYVEDRKRKHEWGSGWLGEAVEMILTPDDKAR